MDHLHVNTKLLKRWVNIDTCLGFIDYEKAFDSIQAVITALKLQGVHPGYIQIIDTIYSKGTSTIRLHKDSDEISIKRGVHLDWEYKGISINGDSHLRFADDI
ncbi:uncharacterized protein [Amphiura filiformis]|uniref:uncharacterized protein n=1 Tax=Amphiura filiformis TaxID=82378 RepID=UPI003B210529